VFRAVLGFSFATLVGALLTSTGLSYFQARSVAALEPADVVVVQAAPTAISPSFHHLPQWVQTRQAGPLWSGPDAQAIEFTNLPAWTFLKVDGARNDRLQVEYAGDGKSRQAGPGWVSIGDVQPSDPGGTWLRDHRDSHLFAESTGSAAVAQIPQWSWMRLLSESANGRLRVRAYSTSLASVIGEGWIPDSDIGPTDAPAQSVWTGGDLKPPPNVYPSHEGFISAVAAAARASGHASGPVSVTVAQAILESNWGESLLSREANNYFGIKATGQIGEDGAVWMRTLEYVQGGSYNAFAAFRAYHTLAESVADHAQLFLHEPAYTEALLAATDPDEFVRRIARAGYATDPTYAQKLIDLMRRYDLYGLDAPLQPNPRVT
jgi:hypothetical protein